MFQQPAGSVLGVGVVLHMGQHDRLVLGLGARGRIKIANDQIRPQVKPLGVAVARIAGYNEIPGAHIAAHGGGYRHGGKDNGTLAHFSHSFRALASSYMAR